MGKGGLERGRLFPCRKGFIGYGFFSLTNEFLYYIISRISEMKYVVKMNRFRGLSLFLVVIFLISFLSSCDVLQTDDILPIRDGVYLDKEYLTDEQKKELEDGLLTACARNDNDYYEYWKTLFGNQKTESLEENAGVSEVSLFEKLTTSESEPVIKTEKFSRFVKDSWGLDSLNRVKVTVTSGGEPVCGASVFAFDNYDVFEFAAVTDATGTAYLFPQHSDGYLAVKGVDGEFSEKHTFDEKNRAFDVEIENATSVTDRNILQIMFVVDATLAMDEEIFFLKTRLAEITSKLAGEGVTVFCSFLFYRDNCDVEKLYYTGFYEVSTEEGLKELGDKISEQRAKGGGEDYPEALDEALELAVQKEWKEEATKLIFHVYDAPAHKGDENKIRFNKSVCSAARSGIKICPILSGNANLLSEYLARQSAIMTGGTYSFLTDGEQRERRYDDEMLDEVTIERLDALIVRLANGYRTGSFEAPTEFCPNKPIKT